MKHYFLAILFVLGHFILTAQTVFINEIRYNDPTLSSKGVEVAGPSGIDLNSWTLEFYDNIGAIYHTESISGFIDNEGANYGAIWFPVAELSDNNDNAIALIDNNGVVQNFVSYGSNVSSTFIGTASGLTPNNTGIVQVLPGTTMQLIGTGTNYVNFSWVLQNSTEGDLNTFQILPVDLLYFKGETMPNGVQLKWETTSELNNSHFEIQRSIDGEAFTSLHKIDGQGTTVLSQTYKYTDKVAEGIYYYRLKQVDIDGQFSYSNVILVQIDGRSDSQLFPNPSSFGQTITIQIPLKTSFDLVIFDAKGQLIRMYTKQYQQVKITDLESGLYIYHIRSKANILQVGQFIILK